MYKRKNYTQKEFTIVFSIMLLFIILLVINNGIIALAESIELSETIEVLSWLGFYALTILVLICWVMCVERYISLDTAITKKYNCSRKISPTWISIVILTIQGINVYVNINNLVMYIGVCWNYLEKMKLCFVIWGIISFGYFVHFGYSIKVKHRIGGQQGVNRKKIIVWLLVLVLLLTAETKCLRYATSVTNAEREAEWLERVTS